MIPIVNPKIMDRIMTFEGGLISGLNTKSNVPLLSLIAIPKTRNNITKPKIAWPVSRASLEKSVPNHDKRILSTYI